MVVEKRIWVVLPSRGREPRTCAWTVLDIGFGGNRVEEKDLDELVLEVKFKLGGRALLPEETVT